MKYGIMSMSDVFSMSGLTSNAHLVDNYAFGIAKEKELDISQQVILELSLN
jgi:hypothetical protein